MKSTRSSCFTASERDALQEHFIHRQKLMRIKPRIDNKPPKIMKHMMVKAKRQLEELKVQAEIQQHNQILLKKLQKIDETHGKGLKLKGNLPAKTNRNRIEEIVKIGMENNKIFMRIQSAKTFYPVHDQNKQYMFNKYLSSQLSENAKRISKNSTYGNFDVTDSGKFLKSPRPATAKQSKTEFFSQRPKTAKYIKEML